MCGGVYSSLVYIKICELGQEHLFTAPVYSQSNGQVSDLCVKPWGCDPTKSLLLIVTQFANLHSDP